MSKTNESFAERMKEHQITWARQSGLSELLEPRKDKTPPGWVGCALSAGRAANPRVA
jgi:hypothetical protein